METSIHERLDFIMEHYRLTQKEFADICGITQQAIAVMRKNKTIPSGSVLIQISHKLSDINTRWLLTGTGEMLLKKNVFYGENVLEAATKTQDNEGVYGTTNEALNSLMAVYRRLVELENENKLLRERLNDNLK